MAFLVLGVAFASCSDDSSSDGSGTGGSGGGQSGGLESTTTNSWPKAKIDELFSGINVTIPALTSSSTNYEYKIGNNSSTRRNINIRVKGGTKEEADAYCKALTDDGFTDKGTGVFSKDAGNNYEVEITVNDDFGGDIAISIDWAPKIDDDEEDDE